MIIFNNIIFDEEQLSHSFKHFMQTNPKKSADYC